MLHKVLKKMINLRGGKKRKLKRIEKQQDVINLMREYGRWLERNKLEDNLFNYEKFLVQC